MTKEERELLALMEREAAADTIEIPNEFKKNNEAPQTKRENVTTENTGSNSIPDNNNLSDGQTENKTTERTAVEIPKGRGRHPLGCPCEKCEKKRSEKQMQNTAGNKTPDGNGKLNDLLSEYKDSETKVLTPQQSAQQAQTQAQQPVNTITQQQAVMVNGFMLLTMCDVFCPFVIKYVFGMFSPDLKKVSFKDIKLKPDQRAAMSEMADVVAKHLFANSSPVVWFFIGMAGMYTANTMEYMEKTESKK